MSRILLMMFTLAAFNTCAQQLKRGDKNLGTPVMTDSASTVFIPVLYDENVFSSNKLAAWGSYYANMVVYNFNTDTYRTLFSKETYIEPVTKPTPSGSYNYYSKSELAVVSGHVFLLVKETDSNGNRRIDEHDPSVLYTLTASGLNLRAITPAKDHVLSVQFLETAGIAMVRFQRDTNGDGSFNIKDTSQYFRKLDLKTMKWGKEIDI